MCNWLYAISFDVRHTLRRTRSLSQERKPIEKKSEIFCSFSPHYYSLFILIGCNSQEVSHHCKYAQKRNNNNNNNNNNK